MAIYGDGSLYRSGTFYGPSDVDTPVNLSFYRTSQDGIYVFYWGFSPLLISPSLFTLDYELQLDTVPTFDSPNLISFLSSQVITYQNGNVRKGYAVLVASRIDGVIQTWYARVRIVDGMILSPWSDTLIWTIPEKVQQHYAESLMESLPDYHVYGKGDLLKPVSQRNSNLYVVENMYGNQLDKVFYTNFLTQTNNYIDLCLDENLYQNFGVLFNFPKPNNMQYVDYRWILINLILASLVGSTNEAIILSISAFTGVPPTIIPIRDELDFFLSTIQDPPIIPSGPTTVFHTSLPFIGATLVVEDITTGLLVSSGSYTIDPVQGTWTMNVATTDTLQATFDVGNIVDPIVTVFDSTSNTPISGTVLFTHGSTEILGFGTSFTTDLTPYLPNAEIADTSLIYLGLIASVADNTHAVLAQPWGGPTENVGAFRMTYTDIQLPVPINWDASTLAFGVLIIVNNPGEFILV